MLLAAPRILQLIDEGVLTADRKFVNAASVDVHLGDQLLVEAHTGKVVDLEKKESPNFREIDISSEPYLVSPGQFFLAHTIEEFNLPSTISTDVMLRSSVARAGLEHLHAGWADAGFHGAQLTLEFINVTQRHGLLLRAGMRIAQIRFFEHEDAQEYSYASIGKYNKQRGAQRSRGI